MTWIAFDTETTGLEPGSRLVELAAVAFADDGTVLDTFASLANPGMPMPSDATNANGITDAQVAEAAPTEQVLGRFLDWLPSDGVLIAHNARYDEGILTWECQRAGLALPTLPLVDTKAMAQRLRDAANQRLQTLVQYHGIVVSGDAHRALPDADAVRQYFLLAHQRTTPSPRPWQVGYAYIAALPAHVATLPWHIANGMPLRFRYCNQAGKTSTPTVIPYGWAELSSGRVLMHGWCTWAKARRNFDVSRMMAA